MKYSDLENGLAYFTDSETQQVIQDPVYFDHLSLKIYERSATERLFADAKEDRENYQQISRIADKDESLIINTLKQDHNLQKIIDKYILVPLEGQRYTIAELLKKLDLADPNSKDDNEIRGWLRIVPSIARTNCSKKAPTRENEAYCPVANCLISKDLLRSAKLFKNVFLIAARNAVEVEPNEFQGKPLTLTLREELKNLSEDDIKNAEWNLDLLYNQNPVSCRHITTDQIKLLKQCNIGENNPTIRTPQQRARDRCKTDCDFQIEESIETQLIECEYALEFIAKAKNLNIANTVEKEFYLSLLKSKYKQLLQHLLTLVQHCNFLAVENFLALQIQIVESIKKYAQTNSTTNEEQEEYKNILVTINEKLREAVDTATQQFTQLPFHQETDTVAAYQKIQEALVGIDKLGLIEIAKVHYRRLLLEAMRNLKNPSIQAAEARFFQHAFGNCSDIKGRRVLIQTALANVDNLNIQDELEVTHYCLLLTQASNHISRVRAENAFYNFYLTLKGDMPSRLYNILNKSTTLQEFLKDELEIMHFQALLIEAQKEFEPSIRLSIKELFSHPEAYARYKHVKKQSQPQFNNDIEKAYYEGNYYKLLCSHRQASHRLSSSVKRFNAENDLSKRKDSIEKAMADIGNERIIDKDEEAIYLALLAEEKTKLESLSVGKKAAEGRFDKLKLFDTDDYSQMECNIQAAFNEQSSISDAEEATHFRVLVGQAQKVSDCLSSISQCMNDAENLVAKADGLCKTARIKTTATNVKKDLSASLEKAIEASYDLGAACQKLTTAGDEAYGIFPGMATDPVNTQTKIEQISASVQNMFASMQKQFQSIQDLCDQIVSKACSLQTEDNSQASQLAMLQQQLDKATEFELPEASTRALLMQMQQESTQKEVRLETAEEQRRHILG